MLLCLTSVRRIGLTAGVPAHKTRVMKPLIVLIGAVSAACLLGFAALAGPEPLPSGKEMKEVAPAPPPECEWCGFYIGLHAGGQFGHSETNDLDRYYFF